MDRVKLNAVIFGGGAQGLWLLGELRRRGQQALLVETNALGAGQTIASQGILHSGLKYSLSGLLTNATRGTREMPAFWRRCLAGAASPNLSGTKICSDSFYLWGTDTAFSRLGMFGAKLGLQVTPRTVAPADRPALLRNCRGPVFAVDEQVICPASLLHVLAKDQQDAMIRVDDAAIEFEHSRPGHVRRILLQAADGARTLELTADWVVFSAGRGNASLRERVGLNSSAMQVRPLHAVFVRGRNLPEIYGHCIDGARTRVSITSAVDSAGCVVWHLGGNISEEGVALDAATLIGRAQAELKTVLPELDLQGTEWATCRVDRAEGATASGARPDSFCLLREGNVLTAWPTKLVLVPHLVNAAVSGIEVRRAGTASADAWRDWPRPDVALPHWESKLDWVPLQPARRAA